jgi:sirohydrochlorin ferrochelatase
LLTGPNEEAYEHIRAAVAASGTTAVVTEPLGPHPLLAEALHVRLAESGLARADRIRQFSIGATVDGVVVATMGGAAAVQEAEITAVLLAARLAVPVIAASLDGRPSVAEAAARLREAGAARLALAPHLIGPEGDHELVAAAAAQADAGCAAPLGAHEGIVRLVNLRYEVALEEYGVGAPDAVGSRKETS